MMYAHLKEQQPYFEVDLLEIIRICNALFHKIFEEMPGLPDLSSGWRDFSGVVVAQQILLQLHVSYGSWKTGTAITVLKAYIAGGAMGMPS